MRARIESIGNGIQQEEQAMTWEYAVFSRTNQPELSEFLNTCGDSGWELVSVVFAHSCYTAFLKRVKPIELVTSVCKGCNNTGYRDKARTLLCICEFGRAKAEQPKEQS